MNRVIRVFPRKTKATPTDELAFIGLPPFYAEADRIEISVSFTWDIPEAERLASQWKYVAPVEIGGPAFNNPGNEFIPGKFIKNGYVITSRGCDNRCWFCSVWKREGGQIRELSINNGWNVLDDNLLACSDQHIREVFSMLKRQKEKIEFTGGLEAAKLQPWHVQLLQSIRLKQMFFAYDTSDDYEPLVNAGKMLQEAGFTFSSHKLRAYVLIGYPKDTFQAAERRLVETIKAGFFPMAMLWRNQEGKVDSKWQKFQRLWARPAIISERLKQSIYG